MDFQGFRPILDDALADRWSPTVPVVFIMAFDECADVSFELAVRGMHAAPQLLAGKFGQPTLDLVDL